MTDLGVWPQWEEFFLVKVNGNLQVELRILMDEEDDSMAIEQKLEDALKSWAIEGDEDSQVEIKDWEILEILN
jgi:hypothetical protein